MDYSQLLLCTCLNNLKMPQHIFDICSLPSFAVSCSPRSCSCSSQKISLRLLLFFLCLNWLYLVAFIMCHTTSSFSQLLKYYLYFLLYLLISNQNHSNMKERDSKMKITEFSLMRKIS